MVMAVLVGVSVIRMIVPSQHTHTMVGIADVADVADVVNVANVANVADPQGGGGGDAGVRRVARVVPVGRILSREEASSIPADVAEEAVRVVVEGVGEEEDRWRASLAREDWFAFVRIQKTASKTFVSVLRDAIVSAQRLNPQQCRQSFCVTKTRDLPGECTHFRNCADTIWSILSFSHVMRCRLLVEPHADYADLIRPFVLPRPRRSRRPACILPEVYPLAANRSALMGVTIPMDAKLRPAPTTGGGGENRAPARVSFAPKGDAATQMQRKQMAAMNAALLESPLRMTLVEAYQVKIDAAVSIDAEGRGASAGKKQKEKKKEEEGRSRKEEMARREAAGLEAMSSMRRCGVLVTGTMVRHPLTRVVSEYKFNAGPGACSWDHGLFAPGPPSRDGCIAFVRNQTNAVGASNRMTKMLAGHSDAHPEDVYKSPGDMLEAAWSHVKEMGFVGLAERFEDSLIVLACRLGLDAHALGASYASHSLVGNKTDGVQYFDYDTGLAKEVLAANQLDLVLYARTAALFERYYADCVARGGGKGENVVELFYQGLRGEGKKPSPPLSVMPSRPMRRRKRRSPTDGG